MSVPNARILILEDEPLIAFYLEDLLAELGCGPSLTCSRLDEAAAIVRQGGFEAAILDVNIHGARSYPIADQLAQRGTPYIFATGYGDTEHPDVHKGVPTLTKPYSLEQLRQALAHVLRP